MNSINSFCPSSSNSTPRKLKKTESDEPQFEMRNEK